jgi:hypothetical protein
VAQLFSLGDFTRMKEQTHSTRFWVAMLTLVGAAILFGGWCVCDYILVHSPRYPTGVTDYDYWFISIVPVVIFAVDYLLATRWQLASRIKLSLLATVLAVPVGVVLVAFCGVPFHWSIGGRL